MYKYVWYIVHLTALVFYLEGIPDICQSDADVASKFGLSWKSVLNQDHGEVRLTNSQQVEIIFLLIKHSYGNYYISYTCLQSCNINHVFSAPEPKAQVHYCDNALSVVSLFVCLSVRRPSVVNFSHFQLLL